MSGGVRSGNGGSRIAWEDVPAEVRVAIEQRAGGRVVDARTQPGGFSPGIAVRAILDDGRRLFVKAVASDRNEVAAEFHRREARVAASLPAAVPAPRLLFTFDDGRWVALGFEDVDGRPPHLPWTSDELARVLAAVEELSAQLTPSPIDAPAAGPAVAGMFSEWRGLASDPPRLARVPPWACRNLDRLVELERGCPAAAAGDTLVHFDLRADNLLVTPERIFVVDWPHVCIGAPWLDLLLMLPSVAMQGGPPPWNLFDASVHGSGATPGAVTAMVCGLAGFFVGLSLLPPPPAIPTLREFQSLQGEQTLAWLRHRTGWA